MLSKSEMETIKKLAKKYKLKRVFLFGSSVESDNYKDIDLGIEGLESGMFFSFYGELFKYLSKPVDLVDLKYINAFNRLVIANGKVIYE
ncbi:MAG: hypothetical protein PF574_06635 [Candidatus Delongbacteria bacterium]|jgi:predicted nucleotidyltransferase|nr:hypothetical protein [Candidatus Delongbacteria bacterium]